MIPVVGSRIAGFVKVFVNVPKPKLKLVDIE